MCFSYFILVLPLISILSVLNKSIGSICSGGKQVRTQWSMIGQENIELGPTGMVSSATKIESN